MKKLTSNKKYILSLILFILQGCGFHLRGAYHLPEVMKQLQIQPAESLDPFQKALRRVLTSNNVQLINSQNITNSQPLPQKDAISTLTIIHQEFQEQPIAYGFDGRLNRARLLLQIDYELNMPAQKRIQGKTRVSRELSIDPNNVLSTDNERQRLKQDLLTDAATQLVLQLSMQCESIKQK